MAAGCSPQGTHFYRPADVPALAALARWVEDLHPGGEFDASRVAELLMIGATDVVGPYPPEDVAVARAVATTANRLLGDEWLARPERRDAVHGLAPSHEQETAEPGSPAEADLADIFADTAHALGAECESRLALLEELRHDDIAPLCPVAGRAEG